MRRYLALVLAAVVLVAVLLVASADTVLPMALHSWGNTPVSQTPTATTTPIADGSRIAYQSNRDGNWNADWEIYVMNADGSGPTNLTNNTAYDGYPAWSSNWW